ncbi:RHS repeat-associated core domain-containing protein [Mucilaginibacter litoreus]|uniref:RHS repeat-associated core domain-containing protein n=1 Tax=Mucilaginibacter litoreus TaxID=1048221 RepID=A0ABW3AUI8_9SPHI
MKRLKVYLALGFILLAFTASNAIAGVEPYTKSLNGPFTLPATLENADPLFLNNGTWATYQFRSVNNEIALRVNDNVRIASNFSYKVNVTVDCYNNPAQTSPAYSFSKELSINYDINQGVSYRGVSAHNFSGYYKVKITINSAGVINAGDQVPPAGAVVLKNSITIDRIYPFNLSAQTKLSTTSITAASKVLPLSWDVLAGAEEYDLEWTTLSAGDGNESIAQGLISYNSTALAQADLLFRNNATRITTAGHDHTISLVFNDDYLVARVRGVQYTLAGVRQTGAWSYELGTSAYAAWNIAANWQSPALNWQYSAAYAEEGKKKEVINYFDGTLRDRQTVTINTSDQVPVVAEKVYDVFGRPVASILPAPVSDGAAPTLHYFSALNKNTAGNTYGYLDISDPSAAGCEFLPGALSTTSGSSRYYSAVSDFKTFNNKSYQGYTPDAQGYPVAITQYTPDNTGRIRLQGGVGQPFQPGSGTPSRTTKYLYGKPEQWELDQLFGNDIGFADHYTKNTVIDPNYQISISYQNASGKTIATALTGAAPAGMDTLTSKIPVRWQTSTILKPEQFKFDGGALKLTASTTYMATVTGKDTIRFDLPQLVYTFSETAGLCGKCYYNVNVKVTDPCNAALPLANLNYEVGKKSNVATTCTPDGTYTNSIPLDITTIGEYNISFEFALNRQDVEAYTDTLFNRGQRAGVINSQWSFVKTRLQALDLTGLFSDCKTSRAQLGTLAAFSAMYGARISALGIDTTIFSSGEQAQYHSIVQQAYSSIDAHINSLDCDISPCLEKQKLMLKDVSPGGQYALFDSSGAALESDINVLYSKWRLVFPVLPATNATYIANKITRSDGSVLSVNDAAFTLTDLVTYWDEEWASGFLQYHPEYCKLQFCELNAVSGNWDGMISEIDKASDIFKIQSGLSYSYTNGAWLLTADPFFKAGGLGNSFLTSMQADLNQYSKRVLGLTTATVKSLSQYVDFNLYQGEGKWNDPAPVSCRVPDRDWSSYRAFYLQLKEKYYTKLRDSTSCAGKCPVGVANIAIPSDPSGVNAADFSVSETIAADIAAAQGSGNCTTAGKFITIAKKVGNVAANTYVFLHFPDIYALNLPAAVTLPSGAQKTFLCIPKNIPLSSITITEANTTGNVPTVYIPQNPLPTPIANQTLTNSNSSSSMTPNGNETGSDFYIYSYQPWSLNTAIVVIKIKPDRVYCQRNGIKVWLIAESKQNGGPPITHQYYKRIDIDPVYLSATVEVTVGNTTEYINGVTTSWSTALPTCTLPLGTVNGCASTLLTKSSRFDAELPTFFQPQDTTAANSRVIQQVKGIIQANCEANAERWMASLAPGLVGKPQATIDSLRNALITYCAANGDMNHIYGSSTAKPGVTNAYADFSAIIKMIALNGGDFTPTLNPWLLEGADRYDKPVTGAVSSTVYNSSAAIAQLLATEQAAATGTEAQFLYLQSKYGSAMTLTQAELGMLLSASASCNWVLPQPITLPSFLQPGNGGCITWTDYSNKKAALINSIPGLTSASTNYSTILTNYMNQQYGFTLSYADFQAFEANHTTLLCNATVNTEAPIDPYAEVQSRMEAAVSDGLSIYATYVTDQKNLIRNGYITTCAAAGPVVTNKAQAGNYHFTLYYYDQADNLMRTVPPEGVALLSDAEVAQVQQLRNGNDAASCGTAYTGPTSNTDVNTAFNNLETKLASGQNAAIELWLYNTDNSGNQLAKVTQDGKYLFQLNINNNTLGIDIFSSPAYGQFNNANRITVSLSTLPALEAWIHVVIQSTDLLKGKLLVYINGVKAPAVNNPLPAIYPDKLVTLKHMRIYGHLLYPAEIMNNAGNNCFMPLNTDAYWARFNVPAAGSETTVGTNSTQETNLKGIYPSHRLVTDYQYNATNQVVLQNSPDGGTNRFWYDQLSRLMVSQNDKQLAANNYSYTQYDALGRIIEVGQKTITNPGLPSPGYVNDLTTFNSGTNNTQITRTFYDSKDNLTGLGSLNTGLSQRNLRKRVVASTYRDTRTGNVINATYYDYDLDGNVANLYQQIGTLGIKQIGYEYDLISGKVNFVRYQEGKTDQFFYKYSYDAENRLTDAYSAPLASLRPFGTSDLLQETRAQDAHYEYYLHGPLARVELGPENGKVQGTDYAYTLQGWLKGINNQNLNATGANADMGADGSTGVHVSVAKDAIGFSLGYYGGDYSPVAGASAGAFAYPYLPTTGEYTGQNLYNGNISSATLAVRQAQLGNGAMTGYTYHYDQLNRLKMARQHTGISGNWDKSSITQLFGEQLTYDGNGNILTLNRHGSAATAGTIDSLVYNYNKDINGKLINNRLSYIADRITTSNYTGDLTTQSSGNYGYDVIGNLSKSTTEKLTSINWSVYGKILSISKATGNISYTYDASGNRVSKTLSGTTTWYVRDAQGNTIAVYDNAGGTQNWREQHLYGSSRLGMWTPNLNTGTGNTSNPVSEYGITGRKYYELSNHLGNVIATISDKRLQTGSGMPVAYLPDIINAQDYYSFGMIQPTRQFTATAAAKYRYGFNGKENDNEVKLDANGNQIAGAQQDYGMRIYDPRAGRFLSVDPISPQYPELTPYQFASNTPIQAIDQDGLEAFFVHGTESSNKRWFHPNDKSQTDFTLINGLLPMTRNTVADASFNWNRNVFNGFVNNDNIFGDDNHSINHLTNNNVSRAIAARDLVDHVMSYRRIHGIDTYNDKGQLIKMGDEPITFITHSHGGNVGIRAANILYDKFKVQSDLIAIAVPAFNGKNDPENPANARGVRRLINVWNRNDWVSGQIAPGSDDFYPVGPNSKVSRIEVDATKFYKWYQGIGAHSFDNNHMADFIRQVRENPNNQNLKKKP